MVSAWGMMMLAVLSALAATDKLMRAVLAMVHYMSAWVVVSV